MPDSDLYSAQAAIEISGHCAFTEMGYDLHITRADYWHDNGDCEITEEEWRRYLASDPELELFPDYGEYAARWSGVSEYPDPWLDWFRGNIYTKNPDQALFGKMLQIARALNARVQGDEGEFYDETSEIEW